MVEAVLAGESLELADAWAVWPIPHGAPMPLEGVSADALHVPPALHLQPWLFPGRAFWGEHLRPVNDQDWVYVQRFDGPAAGKPYVRLVCEGVDYYASVWLNGTHLGDHEGSFAPFAFEAGHLLRAENELRIRVAAPWDKRTRRGTYPVDHVLRGMVKGLYEHSEGLLPPDVNPLGVWRPVRLIGDDGLRIEALRVEGGMDGTAHVRLVCLNVTGAACEGALRLMIAAENHDGPGTEVTQSLRLQPGAHTVEVTLNVPRPHLWWPWDHGDPALYRLEVVLQCECCAPVQRTTTFGFRQVRLERSPKRFVYYVNERPVYVRGTSYIPAVYLSTVSRDMLARDIEFARAANLNLLRAHVHVSLPDFYDLCDRAGMLVWQDSELNWAHDPSPAFEARALALQTTMIDQLYNHPSIITWACHNEPTMVYTRRENYQLRPDPALYKAALAQDSTRPVFICSGQMEADWRRTGDLHSYFGAIWSRRYTDIRRRHVRLNTEFGFEAPAALETLRAEPDVWPRMAHLEGQVAALWAYQAELTRYHVEYFRQRRADSCAGYVHFWLADVVAQVGCGVLDSQRVPKGGYAALQAASAPLHVAMAHDGQRPDGLWVFNDTPLRHAGCSLEWRVFDAGDLPLETGNIPCDVEDNRSRQVSHVPWRSVPGRCARITLRLIGADGAVLAQNDYRRPFQPTLRPRGYPWKFDPYLGCKVFDKPDAPSLAALGSDGMAGLIPLAWRENLAEWSLRQELPLWALRLTARIAKWFGPKEQA